MLLARNLSEPEEPHQIRVGGIKGGGGWLAGTAARSYRRRHGLSVGGCRSIHFFCGVRSFSGLTTLKTFNAPSMHGTQAQTTPDEISKVSFTSQKANWRRMRGYLEARIDPVQTGMPIKFQNHGATTTQIKSIACARTSDHLSVFEAYGGDKPRAFLQPWGDRL